MVRKHPRRRLLKLHTFDDRQSLAETLAERVTEELRAALADRSAATLIVSGGSTPRPMFEALSRQPLGWDQVTVTLADERWVDASHPDSNERLLRQHLFQNAAAAAHCLPLKNDAPSPTAGLAACRAALSQLPRPFDVVVLGMGGDGHFASLFPGQGGLAPELATDGSGLVLAVEQKEPPRMSLSLAALLDTRGLFLHITGDDKRAVLEQAQQAGLAGQDQLPIAAVLASAAERLEVFWAP